MESLLVVANKQAIGERRKADFENAGGTTKRQRFLQNNPLPAFSASQAEAGGEVMSHFEQWAKFKQVLLVHFADQRALVIFRATDSELSVVESKTMRLPTMGALLVVD